MKSSTAAMRGLPEPPMHSKISSFKRYLRNVPKLFFIHDLHPRAALTIHFYTTDIVVSDGRRAVNGAENKDYGSNIKHLESTWTGISENI